MVKLSSKISIDPVSRSLIARQNMAKLYDENIRNVGKFIENDLDKVSGGYKNATTGLEALAKQVQAMIKK